MTKNFSGTFDYDLMLEELDNIRKLIGKLSKEAPYYVYCIYNSDGAIPIYIGKGKGKRIFTHTKCASHIFLDILSNINGISPTFEILEHSLTESDALSLEKYWISYFGKTSDGGTLLNKMSGGAFSKKELSKIGGEIGGVVTRKTNSGIFSPELQHLRKEWATIGAKANIVQNGVLGIYSKKWREENKDKVKEICSAGGKIGGKSTGSMLWWNNSMINKKSHECPGEGWVRGMLMSEKKRSSLFGRK